MTTTEDKTPIDEKKAEESGTSTTNPDFKAFMYNYMYSIIFSIGILIFVIGASGLYTCKVAQSNILPDDIEFFPYNKENPRDVQPLPININIMRTSLFSSTKPICQDIIFESVKYAESFNNTFVCSFKKSADPKKGSVRSLYFSQVYNNLLQKNLSAVNSIFSLFSCLPESLIMVLYGFFGSTIWIGMFLFNIVISWWTHLVKLNLLFKIPGTKDGKMVWTSDMSNFKVGDVPTYLANYFFRYIYLILAFFSAILSPLFFTIYTIICPLFADYKIVSNSDDKQNNKIYTFFDFFKNNFVYKKQFFFILSTISLFKNGQKYLGNNAVGGIIIAVVFAYFMGLYNNDLPQIGEDGFKESLAQCKQASVKSGNDETCDDIPIDDSDAFGGNAQGTDLVPGLADLGLGDPGLNAANAGLVPNADLDATNADLDATNAGLNDATNAGLVPNDGLVPDAKDSLVTGLNDATNDATNVVPTKGGALFNGGKKYKKYKNNKTFKRYKFRLV